MSLPIRLRITIWSVALLAILMAALATFVVIRLRADLVAGVDSTLATRASQISLGLAAPGEGEFQDVSDAALRQLPGSESAAQLLDGRGIVLESSGDAVAEKPMVGADDLATVRRGDPVNQTVALGPDAEPFRVLAIGLPGAGERIVVVATSLDTVDASVGRLTTLLLLAGPALLLVAGLGGWWLARGALAPVSRITRTAGAIGIEHLDERVEVPTTADEIHDLAVTMNGMLERLQRGVADQRRFIADASHELRTPLAVMRAELEVNLREPGLPPEARETLASMYEEIEAMGAMVEDLLTLARADEGELRLTPEPMDLHATAVQVRDALATVAATSSVEVRLEGDRAPVLADRRRIEQVLRNLLANAITYAGRGGHVVISTGTEGGSARCLVRDDGPGIPEAARPHVFDRFFRADPSRTRGGAGLGLAICREIVAAHGGGIEVTSEEGRGTTFTFSIPLREVHDPEKEGGGVASTAPTGVTYSSPSNW
jgi:two-component system, OmpR family, sensor kinase